MIIFLCFLSVCCHNITHSDRRVIYTTVDDGIQCPAVEDCHSLANVLSYQPYSFNLNTTLEPLPGTHYINEKLGQVLLANVHTQGSSLFNGLAAQIVRQNSYHDVISVDDDRDLDLKGSTFTPNHGSVVQFKGNADIKDFTNISSNTTNSYRCIVHISEWSFKGDINTIGKQGRMDRYLYLLTAQKTLNGAYFTYTTEPPSQEMYYIMLEE